MGKKTISAEWKAEYEWGTDGGDFLLKWKKDRISASYEWSLEVDKKGYMKGVAYYDNDNNGESNKDTTKKLASQKEITGK